MQQIIAMGDHRMTSDPQDVALSRYVLAQVPGGVERPKICYLNQAGGEDPSFTLRFYRHFVDVGAEPRHLSLFQPHTAEIADFLLAQDVLYVGGGNTKSLLALWRAWGIGEIVRRAWEAGVVLTGPSAGAICWFEEGSTDSIPGPYRRLPCLGFLAGSCCPHYDGEPERRPSYQRMVASGEMQPGYAIEDFVGVHFVGGSADARVQRVVTHRPDASAYRIEPSAAGVTETRLAVHTLEENGTLINADER